MAKAMRAGIQNGGNYRPEQSFVLFDVRIGDLWLRRKDVEDLASQLGIEVVPLCGSGTLDEMVAQCQKGFNSAWGNFQAEGLIAKPQVELCSRHGERVITKLKCRDFRKTE